EIKEILTHSFENIWVEGEISGFKVSSLDHFYFDLKDESSLISCVVFKWNTKNIDFEIKNGLLVRVLADLTTFDKQSKYQLIVKKIIPINLGKLFIEFEKLKKKLQDEGLFDEKRKKTIPFFPQTVGVVTSLHGAAIRDIVSVIRRRAPYINIIINPVKVQGEGAKEEISKAIEDFNKYLGYVDVILVGRGGGSMEDLWAFNEEIVARAIASSKIPIISCVGHQTDFTIADFVADLRAPTPSAAAEIVSKNAIDVINHIKQIEKRLISTLRIIYHRILSKFFIFINSTAYRNPYSLIEKKAMMLDEFLERMISSVEKKFKDAYIKTENLKLRIKSSDPIMPMKRGFASVRKGSKMVKSVFD
ncbi:MAG: exodeoxyribonuclease VII large subunit, partial [Elusimicrobiales bacterium]